MSLKIKKTEKPDIDTLLNLAKMFNFDNIKISYYENIFTFYDMNKIIGFINYCIIPSMAGKHRVYIRNLYYLDNKYIDNIIKTLCTYCRKNRLTINTTLQNNKFNDECKKAFYNNNFKGEDIIYYLY
jgi:hypothetical protein